MKTSGRGEEESVIWGEDLGFEGRRVEFRMADVRERCSAKRSLTGSKRMFFSRAAGMAGGSER
jgi:hypothetical protein